MDDMKTVETQGAMDRKVRVCPVCGTGALHHKFAHVVLEQHHADYSECAECGSLVIPEIDWLADAYSEERVDPDSGTAQRSVICNLFIRAMQHVGLVRGGARVLDFGAGSGLLVRLLRDQGFDAWGVDKHASMAVARNWQLETVEDEKAGRADVVVAIEVFEHLVDPCEVLQGMVRVLADNGMILLRTTLYDAARHDEHWYYLAVAGGQHITFYSREGVRRLAERCGLRTTFLPFGFHLLTQPSGKPVGCLRKAGLFLLSGLYLTIGRSIGLCGCAHRSIDKTGMTAS